MLLPVKKMSPLNAAGKKKFHLQKLTSMRKRKFIQLAGTLNKDKMAAFSKHLKRLHCNDTVALAVFDHIRKLHPFLAEEPKLEINHAYKKIFKAPLDGNKANRTKMLNALSDLHLWLKEFLLLEKIKSDAFESRTLWMSTLKELGLNDEYARKAAALQAMVEKMPKANIEDYMKGMAANYFFYYHLTHDKQKLDIQALSNCGSDLDLFYAVSRLKIACEMVNRQSLLSQPPSLEVLPAIIELSKAKSISGHPLLVLYHKVYDLISSQEDLLFAELEHLLRENSKRVAPEELHTILSYLHNYAAAQIRRGDEKYWGMAHRLNVFAAENGVLEKSGQISSSQFNNIVNAACLCKDLKWAISFIKKYKPLLPDSIRKDTVALADALVLFEKKEYRNAVHKLADAAFTDLHHAIRSKSLILRSHYEMNDENFDVDESCAAFEIFLKRQQKPNRAAVAATLNFVKIVKKLKRQSQDKQRIINEIENTNPLYFRPWLLEKAAEYKPKPRAGNYRSSPAQG